MSRSARKLLQQSPRPILVRGDGGDSSTLSTLLLARMLPQLATADGPSDGPTAAKVREALNFRSNHGEDEE